MSSGDRLQTVGEPKRSLQPNLEKCGVPKRSGVSLAERGGGLSRLSETEAGDFEQLWRYLAEMNPGDRAELLRFFLKTSRFVAAVRRWR